MTFNLRLPLTLLLWGFLSTGLHANPSATDPEDAAEPNEVDIQFSVYVWPTAGILHENSRLAGVPRAYVQTPDGYQQVPLTRNTATPLLRYRGPLPLELFDVEKTVTPPPAGAPPGTPATITHVRHPRVSVSFPESWQQVMLVVFPGRRNSDGTLLTLPMRYGADYIRPGFIRIHNSTPQNLILQYADQNQPLSGHGFVDIPASEWSNETSLRLNVIGLDPRNRARMLYTTTVNGKVEKSNLYMLYARDTRRLRMLRVGGHKPPPSPSEKGSESE